MKMTLQGELVMLKKVLVAILALCFLICFAGCGAKKTLHCDNCNKEVQVEEKSNMTEDWIIYCDACDQELFGDDSVLGSD